MAQSHPQAHIKQSPNTSKSAEKKEKTCCWWKHDDSKGYFIEPTIIDEATQWQESHRKKSLDQSLQSRSKRFRPRLLEIANNTIYGLTGAVFSDTGANLERAKKEFHVGNLYLNRKCTGALVGSQPFGGFNMSGTDSKAGSFEYLSLFMQGKTSSERLDLSALLEFLKIDLKDTIIPT
ncbi:MAG: aldehyde dehydrogenase family protein [Caldisericia bacterium]